MFTKIKKTDHPMGFPQGGIDIRLELILVGEMLHDVLNTTIQNVAELIDCMDFNVPIVTKTI